MFSIRFIEIVGKVCSVSCVITCNLYVIYMQFTYLYARCVYLRDVVCIYMRDGVCIYIYIHSMRDVAVDLYARWCVYIYINIYTHIVCEMWLYIYMRDGCIYEICLCNGCVIGVPTFGRSSPSMTYTA